MLRSRSPICSVTPSIVAATNTQATTENALPSVRLRMTVETTEMTSQDADSSIAV